jgi:nuclear transport factor 2 (NTF2) superfamily protein
VTETPPRQPVPPFDEAAALQKVRMAEAAWNTRDPQKVAGAYTADSQWRNRDEFLVGREQIVEFLERKWAKEQDYVLRKDLWSYQGNRIAVRFQYEWHDEAGQWYRSYGNENWEFDTLGYMARREASINDVPIAATERRISGPRESDDDSGIPLR